ncbi:hypothetical protein, partial [Caballeronia sp. INML3]|uniref:hypothetical protein n=1 Tax=Caballeronia sp. INML3 TaxID=2921752 RepID=UPI002032212F
ALAAAAYRLLCHGVDAPRWQFVLGPILLLGASGTCRFFRCFRSEKRARRISSYFPQSIAIARTVD